MVKIDQVIRTRRRSMALIVKPDGTLVVRAPLRTPDLVIRAFVESKAAWIAKHRAAAQAAPPPSDILDGASLWFLGKTYRVKVVESARVALTFQDGWVLTRAAMPRARVLLTRWYRAQAAQVLTERVRLWAAQHGLSYQSVKITSANTRWGSCSARNNLNFPWRLMMAPLEIIDYVVAHELAHTVVKNHSRAFWEQVKRSMPDYAARRKWLNENGKKFRLG